MIKPPFHNACLHSEEFVISLLHVAFELCTMLLVSAAKVSD